MDVKNTFIFFQNKWIIYGALVLIWMIPHMAIQLTSALLEIEICLSLIYLITLLTIYSLVGCTISFLITGGINFKLFGPIFKVTTSISLLWLQKYHIVQKRYIESSNHRSWVYLGFPELLFSLLHVSHRAIDPSSSLWALY